MSNWPSEVYSKTITMVKDGVTYTHKKATMLDKDFVLSCWDEAKPIANRANQMTESQYYDLIIQRSLAWPAPGKVPIPFDGHSAVVLRADGIPVGTHHARVRRLEGESNGDILVDKSYTHIHPDHRRKGYFKILTAMCDHSAFAVYNISKSSFAVLDSSIAAKKVHTALGAEYQSSEQTKEFGEIHRLDALKSTWESRESDGLTYSVSSEYIPITDSRWATPAVTLDTESRKWNDI